nr:MAG TPA: ParB-like nuclease domain [Caudoviricetes sp.]
MLSPPFFSSYQKIFQLFFHSQKHNLFLFILFFCLTLFKIYVILKASDRDQTKTAQEVNTMKANEIIYFSPINSTDPAKAQALAEAIRENGWCGAPILVCESMGQLITGSHRHAALRLLYNDMENFFDLDQLGDVAEPVDDIINAWCEENDCTIDEIAYDNLGQIFASTWVEQYKDEIAEW